MDTLIVESFSWNPHIETAGEIAVKERTLDKKVGFCFIDVDNPDDCRFVHRSAFKKKFFIKKRQRIEQLESLLRQSGVEVLSAPVLSETQLSKISDFVRSAPYDDIELLKIYQYQDADIGLAVVSSLISKTQAVHPDLEKHRPLVERYLYASLEVYERSKALISDHRPQKIISFNGRFACAKAIFEAAQALDTPAYFHERGATMDRYELFERQPHDFSYIRSKISARWQQADANEKEKIAHSFFLKRRQGEGIGWKSFTADQRRGLAPKTQQSKVQLVYFSSSDDEFAAVGDLVRHQMFANQRAAIRSLIHWCAEQENYHLTIRIHPHLQHKSAEDRDWWCSLTGKNLQVISPESKVDSYALIEQASAVIVYNSTIGVEATYWGRPAILLGDSFYTSMDCIYEPKSEAALYQLLDEVEHLEAFPQHNCLPYGYYFMRRGTGYEYYQPEGLFSGTFMGQYLGPEPGFYRVLKRAKARLMNLPKRWPSMTRSGV